MGLIILQFKAKFNSKLMEAAVRSKFHCNMSARIISSISLTTDAKHPKAMGSRT